MEVLSLGQINNTNTIYYNIKNLLQTNIDLVKPLIDEITTMSENNRNELFPNFNTMKKHSLLAERDGGFKTIMDIIHYNLKLSSYDDYNYYLQNDSNIHHYLHNICQYDNISRNKEYLISSYHSVGDKIQSVHNFPGAGSYELIGMTLLNNGHSISFVKTGKSDSSWSGIDSNRNANDDNYKLEDIIYKNDNLLQNQLQLKNGTDTRLTDEIRRNKNYYNDNTNNTYLAKVYKRYGYKPGFLLWKKVTLKSAQSKDY